MNMGAAREWVAFGGVSLALMGASLAAGARGYAADATTWQRESAGVSWMRVSAPSFLVWIYRILGLAMALVGVGIGVATWTGHIHPPALAGLPAPGAGVLIAAVGVGFGLLKLLSRSSGPRFLRDEPLAMEKAKPFGERVADACFWGLCVLWTAFGLWIFYWGRGRK